MTSWNIVSLLDAVSSPWLNGGGVTRELVAWPSPADWQWRLSVAQIDKDGAFSVYIDVDRWFAVLQGEGVVLDIDGLAQKLSVNDAPVFFDGAANVGCELVNGQTQDLNLMVRKNATPSRMMRIAGDFSIAISAPQTLAIYNPASPSDYTNLANRSGEATVRFDDEVLQLPPASLAWRHIDEKCLVHVSATQILWMEIPA